LHPNFKNLQASYDRDQEGLRKARAMATASKWGNQLGDGLKKKVDLEAH